MSDSKKTSHIFKKSYLPIIGIVLLLLLAIALLWFNNSTSVQAQPALIAQVYFEGEYRIGDGEWQKIVEGEHIPATKGDVLLRGDFHMLMPDGTYVGKYRGEVPIAFYINHINLTFYEVGSDPFVIDMENPLYGDSACGVNWTAHSFMGDPEDQIEILVHNPHKFGNETAIDEMISNVALWGDISFEKDALAEGDAQRYVGILFIIIAFVFLGSALFSSLIYIKSNKIIWLAGIAILFAGLYFVYSAKGISFWNESRVLNTTLLGISMMLYMLFTSMVISGILKVTKKVGVITSIILGASVAVFLFLPIVSDILFYDTWMWWVLIQLIVCVVLTCCLMVEFVNLNKKISWFYIGALLPLIAFVIDVFGIWSGIWKGGIASQCVFVGLLAVAIIMILKFIPDNINAAEKAKKLEMEKIVLDAQLTETRVSTMMSQIRPHFIYNTLGSIEQLCKVDPPKAGELVHNFAKYLRGNFGELDNPKPILMSQEMEHVRYYVSIENVRFPDMTFSFKMNSDDFHIPALTVQPIVENAIKHGLMKLQRGGTIRVVSYETDTDYCVSVSDDGVGFDTSALIDDRNHVGLRNIRERLKVMVNGTLNIESTVGVGTNVTITIPKEVKK